MLGRWQEWGISVWKDMTLQNVSNIPYRIKDNLCAGVSALPDTIYQTLPASPRSRMTMDFLQEWVWDNPQVRAAARGSVYITWQTTGYFFKQIGALPEVIYTLVTHAPTRSVAGHILRITLEDLLPVIIISQLNTSIQKWDTNPNASWLSIDTLAVMGLGTIRVAAEVLNFRLQTRMLTRTFVTGIEAGSALKVIDEYPRSLCDDNCGIMKFVKGSVRGGVGYVLIKFTLFGVSYVSEPLAQILDVSHNGDYILTAVLPRLCQQHKLQYLQEHMELALSLGISHACATNFLTQQIAGWTDVPIAYYQPTISSFLLLLQISIAARMRLPAAVNESKRYRLSLIQNFMAVVDFCLNTIGEGSKVTVPPLFREKKQEIDWGSLMIKAQSLSDIFHGEKIYRVFFPFMFHERRNFINDPVIASQWDSVRQEIIAYLNIIKAVGNSWAGTILTLQPEVSANILWLFKGWPTANLTVILNLMANKPFMIKAADLRRELEAMKPDKASPFKCSAMIMPLRRDVEDKFIREVEDVQQQRDLSALDPEQVFAVKTVVKISDNPNGFYARPVTRYQAPDPELLFNKKVS